MSYLFITLYFFQDDADHGFKSKRTKSMSLTDNIAVLRQKLRAEIERCVKSFLKVM